MARGSQMNATFKINISQFVRVGVGTHKHSTGSPLERPRIFGVGLKRRMYFCSRNLTNCTSRFLFISFSSCRENRIFPIPSLLARGLAWHIANLVIMQFISRFFYSQAWILCKLVMSLTAITLQGANEQPGLPWQYVSSHFRLFLLQQLVSPSHSIKLSK